MSGDYKVNLPKTTFPMKADLPKREPEILAFWKQLDWYRLAVSSKSNDRLFVVHDGPPYANGDIHLGHAFNKIIKDVINKIKLMEGYKTSFVPGWDCHGLPIELRVEKEIGKVDHKTTPAEFINQCRKYAGSQMQLQMDSFKRLGVLADWEHRYCTMDFSYEAKVIQALADILANGYLISGYKPVNWCIKCGSALAEAEVEYQEKKSSTIDVRFQVVNPELLGVKQLTVPIWTTTPWTLPANEAVAANPNLEYVIVYCPKSAENLLVLKELLSATMIRYGESEYQVKSSYLGKELSNLILQHPFLTNKKVPVVLGEHVTAEVGTGLVHTAPAHGIEDYQVGLKCNLPVVTPVLANGQFDASVKFFAGLSVLEADKKIIEVLSENNNLIASSTIQHSYPHCWRHKTPLIFLATKQWFIGMDIEVQGRPSLRAQALEAISKVKWLPDSGVITISNLIKTRPDWCISRQRLWGTPMTLLINKKTGRLHPQMVSLIKTVIVPEVQRQGIVYWQELDPVEFLNKHAPNEVPQDYEKLTDTLDVWFDSGVTHGILGAREDLSFPADLYIEGIDQYRGWFQSSLLTALALYGTPPYRTVVSHGFIVDQNGHKMSKSLGNVVAPSEVFDKYGADVLRLWSVSLNMHNDLAFSAEILKQVSGVYRLVRNSARFLLGNLCDFNVSNDLVKPEQMLGLDRFFIAKTIEVSNKIRNYYDNYQFHSAILLLVEWLDKHLSRRYFSIIKDRLYTMSLSSFGRKSAQTACFYLLEFLVRLIAPVLSFTAEEVWQEFRKLPRKQNTLAQESVFLINWNELEFGKEFDLSDDLVSYSEWDELFETVIPFVNKHLEEMRIGGKIGSSLEVSLTLPVSKLELFNTLKKIYKELKFLFLVSDLKLKYDESLPSEVLVGWEVDTFQDGEFNKCLRCWHHDCSVGENYEHPKLCKRCISNLFGQGEVRKFV